MTSPKSPSSLQQSMTSVANLNDVDHKDKYIMQLEQKTKDQKMNIIELLRQNDMLNVENRKLKRQQKEGEELRDELMRSFTAEIARLKDEIFALRQAQNLNQNGSAWKKNSHQSPNNTATNTQCP